jgi:hypothetical protein
MGRLRQMTTLPGPLRMQTEFSLVERSWCRAGIRVVMNILCFLRTLP